MQSILSPSLKNTNFIEILSEVEALLKLFYHTKNIIGLIFLLIPSIGFLFYSSSVSSPFLLMASITLGIPSGRILYSRLSFSFWLCFMTIVCSYSIFIQAYFPATTAAYAACALLGFCSGGLLFILPPNITAGWFYTNKFQTLGIIFSAAILSAFPFVAFLRENPALVIVVSSLFMIFASVFLLDKPVFINSGNFLDGTGHIKRSRFKLSLFFLLITFSLGFACRIGYMAWPGMGQLGFQLSDQKLFIYLGMTAGPAVSALVSGKKGVYSSSVLLIFLSELAIVSAGFYSSGGFMSALGNFAFGASLSSLLVICPLMIYYMLGPASYNNNLGRICPFLPLGLMSLFPFSTVENSQLISSPAIFSILLILVISFFIIFSAWKHRFVLLK